MSSPEEVLRACASQVLAALARRYEDFDAVEDATQEALLVASQQWPRTGLPDDPAAWLIAVASRRFIDGFRSEQALRRREAIVAAHTPQAVEADAPGADTDDTLTLLFYCCHPAISQPSQLALTLRAFGGLTTAQIARALLVPETTLAQRISRAKRQLRDAGASFSPPGRIEYRQRLDVVLQVLYLIYNEGHTSSEGADLHRADLTGEAIRLGRMLHRLLPDEGEVVGLLALMLLTEARAAARTDHQGRLVPLAEQDRSTWSRPMIDEGIALVTATLGRTPPGAYQLQAAIAAVHAEAPHPDATDWPQIVALYAVLSRIAPNPMVTLNQAVAVAMAHGPRVGLAMLEEVRDDPRIANHHRLAAVRAHLYALAGDSNAARAAFADAARLTTSLPEQQYLSRRASELSSPGG